MLPFSQAAENNKQPIARFALTMSNIVRPLPSADQLAAKALATD